MALDLMCLQAIQCFVSNIEGGLTVPPFFYDV